jgi:hypothetical protein
MPGSAHTPQHCAVVLVFCVFQTFFSKGSMAAEPESSIDRAFKFLNRQMDRYHQSIIIVGDPEYSAYYPSGLMGDYDALSIERMPAPNPNSGKTGYKVAYTPGSKPQHGWAGIWFQYPAGNWRERPGRNLLGATKISFWIRAEHPEYVKFLLRRGDLPGGPAISSELELENVQGEEWRRYTHPLDGFQLHSVRSLFGLKVEGPSNTVYIDDATVDLPDLDAPRFVQSYVTNECAPGGPPNAAHVYDQALTLLAYLARATHDDLRRAELIARALVQAQRHDRTFRDGRLRNAYASGELIDPDCGCTRITGQWDFQKRQYLEDEFGAGTDTGNMAWAGLALVQAHEILPWAPDSAYLSSASLLGKWIVDNTRVASGPGGFSGGFEGFENTARVNSGQFKSSWRSTEHNIDLVAFFRHLAAVTTEDPPKRQYWLSQADHAQRFVDQMRAPDGHLWTGTVPGGDAINNDVIPLDAQTWSVLGLGRPRDYQTALVWAMQNCRTRSDPVTFDFNCHDGDGTWWEGTAQVATALRLLGLAPQYQPLLKRLGGAQIKDGPAAGAIPAASVCRLTTGFDKTWHSAGRTEPWLYGNAPHTGATAWHIFGSLGANPFDLRGEWK